MTENISLILAAGTVLAQILIVLGALYFWAIRRQADNPLVRLLGRYGLTVVFLISLLAVLGSLFYSQLAGFPPCDLCWWQRIFMYPLVLILGWGIYKKDYGSLDYALLLALAGTGVSLYHNYIYYGGADFTSCQSGGLGINCLRRFVWEFNYIGIPQMALTAFLLILLILAAIKYIDRRRPNS